MTDEEDATLAARLAQLDYGAREEDAKDGAIPVWLLCELPEFLRYIMLRRLISVSDADKVLETAENTECRAILLNYVNDNRGSGGFGAEFDI